MNKNYKIVIAVFIAFTVLFSACKSTPKAKPDETPASKPAEQPAEGIKHVPDSGKAESADELEKIRNGRLKTAREHAVELKADIVYLEEFAEADATAANAEKEAENGRIKEAIAKYNEAADRYETLSNLMAAAALRGEIEKYGFARFASEDYAEAEKLAINTLEHYGLDYKMAKETSEDTLKLYTKVTEKGYFEFAKSARNTAKESKADCDSIRAARSRTDDYNNAVRLFNEGKAKAEEKDFRAAFYLYNTSAESFKTLYNQVASKRVQAEAAMNEAARKQQESSALALEADKEAPLTEDADGFSGGELELEDKTTQQSGQADDIDETESTDQGDQK